MNRHSNGRHGLPWQRRHLSDVYDVLIEVASRGLGGTILTVNPSGEPYGLAVEAISVRSIKKIVSLVDAESIAALNIMQNSEVAWVLRDENRNRLLHLRGQAKILLEPGEVRSIYDSFGEFLEAKFSDKRPVGIEYFPVETRIAEVEYRSPSNGEPVLYDVSQIEMYSTYQDRNAPFWVGKFPFKSTDNERLR
ncbi:MAG: hypothetical protein KJT03_04965 [Verrucomicrobiae bacterium]|nr:hypothetical protein [Verrucomicrobiae bacterium]